MLGDVTAIYYRPCNVRSKLSGKTGHCIRPVAAERRAALDLAKRCFLTILHDKINFVSVGVAIVVYLGMPALRLCRFYLPSKICIDLLRCLTPPTSPSPEGRTTAAHLLA